MIEVQLASLSIDDLAFSAIDSVLKSGNFTMGSEVEKFEEAMAQELGAKHFLMVNSGSSANLLMIEALMRPVKEEPKLLPGDSVLVPAVAWPTTVWPLIQLGLKPIFVDVDKDTLAIDPLKASRLLETQSGDKIKAIFLIHPLGLAVDMAAFEELASEYKLTILSDVCESLGARNLDGTSAGSSSLMRSYSFYFSHHITTMEGGGVATDSSAVFDDLISMRSHGWSRGRSDEASWTLQQTQTDRRFSFVGTGYNFRPMEIQGAIGRTQLSSLEEFLRSRRHLANEVYDALLGSNLELIRAGIENIAVNSQHSWMLLPFRVLSTEPKSSRDFVCNYLEECGVATRPILTGNFLRQPSVKRFLPAAGSANDFPVAERVHDECFMVGADPSLTPIQREHLVSSLLRASSLLS